MMKLILLTQGKVAIVDDEDYAELSQYKWYLQKGRNTFYAARTITVAGHGKNRRQKHPYMHREIMGLRFRYEQVDHINRNGLDNRKCNLRACGQRQNSANSEPRKRTSQYKGVSWAANIRKWESCICMNRKKITLGYYANETEAAKVRDKATRQYQGRFGYLNFPE